MLKFILCGVSALIVSAGAVIYSELSEAKTRVVGASANNVAIFVGGVLKDGSLSSTVDLYDLSNNVWVKSRLSSPRSDISGGSFGSGRFAIFAGGVDSNFKPVDIVDIYDSNNGSWKTVHLGVPRGSPAILNLGDKAAIVGGITLGGEYVSDAVEYIDQDLQVTSGYPLKVGQEGVGASDPSLKEGLFAAGYINIADVGERNNFQTTANAALVSDSQTEKTLDFPLPRWEASAAAVDGVAAYAGGYTFGENGLVQYLDDVTLFNFETQQWQKAKGSLSTPRSAIHTGILGNKIVFAGGINEILTDVVDLATGEVQPDQSLNLTIRRSGAGSAFVNNCIMLVAGGLIQSTGELSNIIEINKVC